MKKNILFTVFLFGCICSCYAQFKLDSAFGKKGIVMEDLGIATARNDGKKVLVHPDGSIYIICDFQQGDYIAKRHPDGSPDSTYGLNGFSLLVNIDIADAAFLSDGKIVVAGTTVEIDSKERYVYRFVLARFNTDGSVDSNFAVDGKQVTNFGSNDSKAFAIGIQNDGKIVAAGVTKNGDNYDIALARYTIQGNLDETFSDDGKQITRFGTGDEYAYSLVIAGDGKIVVGGYTSNGENDDFALARYTANGKLDKTFSEDGKLTTDFGGTYDRAYSVAIQSNGKIVVLGSSNSALTLAEYNTDGSLDNDFSGDGKLSTQFGLSYNGFSIPDVLALQTDGKIVTIGDGALARYNANGTIDSTFNNERKVNAGITNSLAIQNDDKIVLAGYQNGPYCGEDGCIEQFSLARYTGAGKPDVTFGKNGQVTDGRRQGTTTFIGSVIQKDGKIVALGSTLVNRDKSAFVLVRYTPGGSLDTTFSHDGIKTISFGREGNTPTSLAIQNDGKLLIMGTAYNFSVHNKVLARYNADGSPDNSFNGNGQQASTTLDDGGVMAIQHGGKIIIAGSINLHNFGLIRFNPDGSPDNTFGTGGKQETVFSNFKSEILSVAIQSDNKIVVAGRIFKDDYNLPEYVAVARYDVNGILDKGFSGDGKDTFSFGYYKSQATSVVVQPDGKIVIGGHGSDPYYTGTKYFAIVRYNADGSRDSTFSSDGLQTTRLEAEDLDLTSLALQSNGKILAGGRAYGTIERTNIVSYVIASYNPDGILDTIFTSRDIGIDYFLNQISVVNNQLYITGSNYIHPTVRYLSFGEDGIIARYLLNDKTTAPPIVKLTSPADNASFPIGGNLLISAVASAAGGTITKVEFFSDTMLLFTAIDTPFVYNWANVAAGKYTLTARATNNTGRTAISAAVHITVTSNRPPLVNITSPAGGSNSVVAHPIRLSANASDSDGTIRSVEFYSDSTSLFTETKPPYTRQWYPYITGSYIITAVATDNEGSRTTSAPVHITVLHNRPPIVSLTSPANGTIYTAPATIVLSADALGHGAKIKTVKFYNGTTLLHTEENLPYSWEWKNVPPGAYTITANATDTYDRTTTSLPVAITVTPPVLLAAGGKQSNASVSTTGHSQLRMQLSPNPAKNILKINIMGLQVNSPSIISLISASGVLMQTRQIENLSQMIQFNISSLPGGTYVIKFEGGGNVIYKLFIKA